MSIGDSIGNAVGDVVGDLVSATIDATVGNAAEAATDVADGAVDLATDIAGGALSGLASAAIGVGQAAVETSPLFLAAKGLADASQSLLDILGGNDVNSDLEDASSTEDGDIDSKLSDVLQQLQTLLNDIVKDGMGGKSKVKDGSDGGEGSGAAEGAGSTEGASGSEAAAAGSEAANASEGVSESGSGSTIFDLLAEVMGNKMKEAFGKLEEARDAVDSAEGDDAIAAQTELTAAAQEFQFLSQTFNTAINALGQGASTAARKQ